VVSGVAIKETKPSISSPLIEEPSIADIIQIHGEDSQRFLSPHSIHSYVNSSFPNKMTQMLETDYAAEISSGRISGYLHRFKEWFNGAESKVVDTETPLVRIGELHRPKVDGCTAVYDQSYSSQSDFSIEVKVLGVGGGASYTKQVAYSTTVEISENCIALTIPVTIEWTQIKTRSGDTYYRSKVKDIATNNLTTPELTNYDDDHCRVNPDQVQASRWPTTNYDLPKGLTRTENLFLATSMDSELSLQSTIAGIEIGPKVKVQFLRKVGCTYKLIGPHKYTAFLPTNGLGYCWLWA
jgi:hypothetical protein